MRLAIDLDNEAGGNAQEISNEWTDGSLSTELRPSDLTVANAPPEAPLTVGHVVAHGAGAVEQEAMCHEWIIRRV
jgi:hypothetical protein